MAACVYKLKDGTEMDAAEAAAYIAKDENQTKIPAALNAKVTAAEDAASEKLATALKAGNVTAAVDALSTTVKDLPFKTTVKAGFRYLENAWLNVVNLRDLAAQRAREFTTTGGKNLLTNAVDQVNRRAGTYGTLTAGIDDRIGRYYLPGKVNTRTVNELMSLITQEEFDPRSDTNTATTPGQKEIVTRWRNLGSDSNEKKLISSSLDEFKTLNSTRADALEQYHLARGVDPEAAKAQGDLVRFARLEGYLAQDRIGEFTNTVKNANGETIWFSRHEGSVDAEATRTALKEQFKDFEGIEVSQVGQFEQREKAKFDTTFENFISNVVKGLEKKGVTQEAIDDVVTQMRDTQTEALINKYNKNERKRLGVAGADGDMMRANFRVMNNTAARIATLIHQLDITKSLGDVRKHIEANRSSESYDLYAAQSAFDIFNKAISYSSTTSPMNTFANNVNTVGFVHTMAGNVSSGAVNTISGSIMVAAEIAARYGASATAAIPKAIADASNALLQIRRNVKSGKANSLEGLTGDVKDVFEHARKYNVIGAAQVNEALDIVGNRSMLVQKFLRYGGVFMTVTENAVNMTAMVAGYRAALNSPATKTALDLRNANLTPGEKTMSLKEFALEQATEIRYRANPDNSAANKSYLGRMPLGRIMLQLKGYGIAMTNSMYRDVRGALSPSSTREERVYALKHLTGVLGGHALVAGATGMPFMIAYPLMAMTSLAAMLVGSDDPDEANLPIETRVRNYITQAYGEDAANYLYYGIGGASIAKRVSLGELILRDPFGKEQNEPVDYLKQLAGPTYGAAESWYKLGKSTMEKSGTLGGPEAFQQAVSAGGLPAGIANVLKGYNLLSKPIPTQKDGTQLLDDGEQITSVGAFMQLLGFRPASIAEAQGKVQAIKGVVAEVGGQRRALVESYRYLAQAEAQGFDVADIQGHLAQATATYNAKYPEKAVEQKDIAAVAKKLSARASETLVHLSNADAKVVDRTLPWTRQQ